MGVDPIFLGEAFPKSVGGREKCAVTRRTMITLTGFSSWWLSPNSPGISKFSESSRLDDEPAIGVWIGRLDHQFVGQTC